MPITAIASRPMQEAIAKSVNATRRGRAGGAIPRIFRPRARRRAAAALPVLPRAGRRATACARPAGRSCRSSRRPIASGSAFRSPTIPAPACCRCRRSPIRRPITAPAPRCATTTSRARWCMRCKYGDRLDLAPTMGRWMARAGRELLADADALVPVPLHWRRLWARRFNQSALLAKAIAQESGIAGRRHGAQARQGDRAAGRAVARPSAPATCRARSACPPSARPRWPAGAWC